jgi:hypothetical protein
MIKYTELLPTQAIITENKLLTYYDEHDCYYDERELIAVMHAWCLENFGENPYKLIIQFPNDPTEYPNIIIEFKTQADMMLFKMRW